MIIQHNITALNSHRNLGINNSFASKNLEKLSSGYRINRAGDDAAGLAISEKMRGQIRGLSMAENNAKNGISLIQTAEGGLQEVHSILQRMRELAVQSSNGTYQEKVDRENLDLEFQALKGEIDRIADYTHYNGIKLLNGNLSSATTGPADAMGALTFQVGANGSADQRIIMQVVDMHASALGSFQLGKVTNTRGAVAVPEFAPGDSEAIDASGATVTLESVNETGVGTWDMANKSVEVLDFAINMVSTQRAGLGAMQNRLEYTLNNLGVTKENLTSAESVIRDVDMAKEMMDFTKNQILVQASQAMLAQANQLPQGVLNLLR